VAGKPTEKSPFSAKISKCGNRRQEQSARRGRRSRPPSVSFDSRRRPELLAPKRTLSPQRGARRPPATKILIENANFRFSRKTRKSLPPSSRQRYISTGHRNADVTRGIGGRHKGQGLGTGPPNLKSRFSTFSERGRSRRYGIFLTTRGRDPKRTPSTPIKSVKAFGRGEFLKICNDNDESRRQR
jgi:hypothetical protein